MNGMRSLSPTHTRSPMWVMLKIFICNLLWLAEYQCKSGSRKDTSTHYQFLFCKCYKYRNCLRKRATGGVGGGGGVRKRTIANKEGGGGQNSGILRERTFRVPPIPPKQNEKTNSMHAYGGNVKNKHGEENKKNSPYPIRMELRNDRGPNWCFAKP